MVPQMEEDPSDTQVISGLSATQRRALRVLKERDWLTALEIMNEIERETGHYPGDIWSALLRLEHHMHLLTVRRDVEEGRAQYRYRASAYAKRLAGLLIT